MCRNNLNKTNNIRLKTKVTGLVFAILWCWLFPASVAAHKVTIFAWVDGDTIYTQSKFSGGKRVKNAPVLVYGPKDVLLLDGKTDNNGMFFFKIPKKTSLKIVLKASMGHMAVWKIPVEALVGTEPKNAAKPDGLQNSIKPPSGPMDIRTHEQVPGSLSIALGKREIEAIIDASLDKKLAPITEILVDSIDSGPGFTEIMGGIGYIFGLVGVALYFANRKRKRND
jgi:nickel transport protein